MKRLSILFLSVFAICLSGCAVVVDDFWNDWDDEEEISYTYDECYCTEDMRSIEIEWYYGPVRIVRSSGSGVYCEERVCSRSTYETAVCHYYKRSSRNLFIAFCLPGTKRKVYEEKELIVYIPRCTNIETVKVHNRCGDVTIEGGCRCGHSYHYNDGIEVNPVCDQGQVYVTECK